MKVISLFFKATSQLRLYNLYMEIRTQEVFVVLSLILILTFMGEVKHTHTRTHAQFGQNHLLLVDGLQMQCYQQCHHTHNTMLKTKR